MASFLGDGVLYCCVCRGSRILFSNNGGDRELDSIAGICLERAPPFHAWYFETARGRTYGLLVEEGLVYFAISDSSVGSAKLLSFLRQLRDRFKKGQKSELHDELVPIIRRLKSSLENVSRPASVGETPEISPTKEASSSSSKSPLLLGKVGSGSGKLERKKLQERAQDIAEEEGAERGGGVGGAMSLQNFSSFTRQRNQQNARRLWCRLVRIVVAIDVLVCLILLAVWLVICRGLQCVSG